MHNGPEYFHQFHPILGLLEIIKQVPVVKLGHVPVRAMDINQSTVNRNITVGINLLYQGGVGDPYNDSGSQNSDTDEVAEGTERGEAPRKQSQPDGGTLPTTKEEHLEVLKELLIDDICNVTPYVILIQGDLGIWEHVKSLLAESAIEDSPCQWIQFTVFVLGFFHLKMAAIDAIWQIFIQPKVTQHDDNSL